MDHLFTDNLKKDAECLIDFSLPAVSSLSNLSRLLFERIPGVSWAGFYLAKENYLYLGPYQGPLACTKIAFGKGVCGTAAETKKSILVPDVNKFPGHIACSDKSRSELVVPILKENKCLGVIDLDSESYDNFNEKEKEELEEIALLISGLLSEEAE